MLAERTRAMSRILMARLSVGAMILLGATLLVAQPEKTAAADATTVAPAEKCACADYQNDRCECAEGKHQHKTCPCKTCSGDAKCECIVAARQSAGSITGTITLWRARAKTKGPKSYKDVVVYLEKVNNNDFPPQAKPARVDQKGLVFIPHVLVVQKGTPIEFTNSDNDKHNVYFLEDASGKTNTKNLGTWMPGDKRSHSFKDSKVVTTLCKLHLEMAAYIIVLDNPFFTKVTLSEKPQRASFTIKNVPAGKYSLRTWHKKLKLKGGVQEVVVEAGKSTATDLILTKAKYANKK